MPLTKDKSTPENEEYWRFVEKTAEEVRSWPSWKTGRPARSEDPARERPSNRNYPPPREPRAR